MGIISINKCCNVQCHGFWNWRSENIWLNVLAMARNVIIFSRQGQDNPYNQFIQMSSQSVHFHLQLFMRVLSLETGSVSEHLKLKT